MSKIGFFGEAVKKMLIDGSWKSEPLKVPDYFIKHEHPIASGKGHAAAIKRKSKKRRNKK